MELVSPLLSAAPRSPKEQTKCKEVEVVFGSPSKYCEGLGICVVSIFLPRSIRCPKVKGLASYAPLQNRIYFSFQKDAVGQPHILKCLSQGIFIVEEAFQVSAGISKSLGLRPSWILPGIYPVFSDEWSWHIGFSVC